MIDFDLDGRDYYETADLPPFYVDYLASIGHEV